MVRERAGEEAKEFAVEGTRHADGKRVRVRGVASSRRAFIQQVESTGISVFDSESGAVEEKDNRANIRRSQLAINAMLTIVTVGSVVIFVAIVLRGVVSEDVSAKETKLAQQGAIISNGDAAIKAPLDVDDWTTDTPHPKISGLVSSSTPGQWIPLPGYALKTPGLLHSCTWVPGALHPDYPHIHASSEEQRWRTDPGYGYRTDLPGDFEVEWRPAQRHPEYDSIYADEIEGRWCADPGYVFVEEGSLLVEWRQGRRHHEFPNITSGTEERTWRADAGFRFPKTGSLHVEWQEGVEHPNHPNVLAGRTIHRWRPADGYAWIDTEDASAGVYKQPERWTLNWNAAQDAFTQAAFHQGLIWGVQAFGEGGLLDDTAIVANQEARERALEQGLRRLIPQQSASVHSLLTIAIANILDNPSSVLAMAVGGGRDGLVRALERKVPALENHIAATDVIMRIMERYFQF